MKILLVSDSPLRQTGYGKTVRDLHRMFTDLGHEVVFLGMHSIIDNGTAKQEYIGSRVYAMQGPGDLHGLWQGADKHWIQSCFLVEKPDIALIIWDLRKVIGIVRDFDRFFRCPTFLYWLFDSEPISHQYIELMKTTKIRVLPVTECIAEWMQKLGMLFDWKPIPLPVDLAKFYPLPAETRNRLKVLNLGDNAEKVCFGFVGGNFQRKNIPFIIDAFAQLPPEILEDSVLLLHTDPDAHERNPQSYDLRGIIKSYCPNLKDKVIYSHSNNDIQFNMCEIYNVMDWQISGTTGEGWGLCLGGDTSITASNYRQIPIRDLNIGDSIVTASNRISRIKRKTTRFADTIHIESFCVPALDITSEHPIWAIKRGKGKLKDQKIEPGWIKAGDLGIGDFIAVPKRRMVSLPDKPTLILDMMDYVDNVSEYNPGFIACKMGYSGKTGRRCQCKRHIEINEDFMWLAGWYLAEGSCDGGRRLEIDLHVDEMETAYKLQQILHETFGVDSIVSAKGNKCRVRCSSSAVAKFMGILFGIGAHNKIIPEFLLNNKFIIQLIDAYFLGDGHHDKNGYIVASSVSKALLWQIWHILLSYNIIGSIATSRRTMGKLIHTIMYAGESYNRLTRLLDCDCYTVGRRRGRNYIEDEEYFYTGIYRISDSGPRQVFDIELDDKDHSFIANGIRVHNCTLEGMACGIPMIIGDISTTRQILGETGIVVPIGSYFHCPNPYLKTTLPNFRLFVTAMIEAYQYCRSIDPSTKFPEWDIRAKKMAKEKPVQYSSNACVEQAAKFSIESVQAQWREFFDYLALIKPPGTFTGWHEELINEPLLIAASEDPNEQA